MANDTVTKQFGVGIVFILILIDHGCCKNIDCDVNQCKSLFSTVFKDFLKEGLKLLCRSSNDAIECIDKCLQIFFPDFDFVNSKTSIASEVCSYDLQHDLNLHWNCISRHFHRLLTCMSKSGSMKTTDKSIETLKMLSCKKFLNALNCPYEILYGCEDKAVDMVNELFSKVFKVSMDFACNTVSLNVHDLPVTYDLNNRFINTSACLDKRPDIASNCFPHYLNDFDADEVYRCRNTCENLDRETCLPSSLMKDFYIPVLSFGKHKCKEDSTIEDKLQIQEPTTASAVSSDVHSKYATESLADEINDHVSSDEIKSDVLSFNHNAIDTSTLNDKPIAHEIEHDKVLSDIHSSIDFSSDSSIPSKVHPKINSLSSDYAADNATDKNGASGLEYYLQYFLTSLIIMFILF